ncbi:MAG: glycoside hydrolase family 57 protein [Leptospirales bacterium]
MKAKVLFVWHMHQPYYYDPVMGEMSLPWVRLHGIRGYNDLPFMIERFPLVHHTVNIVPSLLDQIELLASGAVVDSYYQLSEKAAAELSLEEKVFMIRNFFSCPYDSMIKPYPRYASLWSRVNTKALHLVDEWEKMAVGMGSRDFLDLQVWFNLTWFGYAARKTYPVIEDWIRKGGQFTEDEKREVLKLQTTIVGQLIPVYRRLQSEGLIEISSSPYFHPILPLLISSRIARRPRPELDLPEEFTWPEDARDQLELALDRHAEVWGRRPVGVWPSEGSVCPELLKVAGSIGIQWMATDEEILRHSRPADSWRELSPYHIYSIDGLSDSPRIVFRDRGLSDRIGFLYARYNGTEAALDLISNMERIEHVAGLTETPVVIPIILDGENPWESYPDGGYLFLHSLLERLEHHPHLHGVTVSEAIAETVPKPLAEIASGSWINHDFNIWIGHHEDNVGWNYLGKTRQFLEDEIRANHHSPDQIQAARKEMFAAEGSDWFWWFGDDFQTVQSAEFDRLFRVHQQNVYRILGREIPLHLNEPVQVRGHDESIIYPVDFVQPIIDGMITHYYEWTGAGVFDAIRTQGAMFLGTAIIQKLFFGFDRDRFYLRVDLDPEIFEKGIKDHYLMVRLSNKEEFEWRFPLQSGPLDVPAVGRDAESAALWACRKVGEMAVQLERLGIVPGEWIYLTVELSDGHSLLDQCPRGRAIPVHTPDERFAQSIWRV